ncbi:VPS10 domain-containing protein [Fulvivirga lutimaris]|uniref:VPS10 domain-containing protein n=1 Tax=Fulvivirga lutimaris TaxID=1819566 RepID=UPI0012BC4BF0|nr:glycosyl hydrolase [Fulvivirga lutimaris]MTI39270.1 glycosyl hydrolase [Fulvivirga lutimaris]
MHRSILLILLFAVALLTNTEAQRKSKSSAQSISYDQSLYEGMKWRSIGPYRGGRAGTATGVVGNNNLYYMGTAGGGVWRTTDGGSTWECISDGYFGGSIGAVAVAESDPNVIYVGEGEQTLRGNVSSGRGVWKSTDAGKSWIFIGLKGTEHISRIRIHPTNPDIVYVAAIGNLWKENSERGVYRSMDGGKSWERILYVSDKAGAGDLVFDPNNPRIMYAATWQMKRNGYRMDSGGPDSKIFKSTDSGDSWTELKESGLPKGPWGIVGLAVSPVNSERVWAIIEAKDGGLFRSDNAGKTWIKTSANRALRSRAWYYSRITADSQNEDMIYVMNVSYGVSKDGGKTFELKNAPHGDHHDLWIDPNNNQRMIIADDGGAQISTDGGNNWTTYHNQPTAQFYRVATDNAFPYRIYGAQQDNSAIRIASRNAGNAITESDWESTAGGESAHLAPDPKNNDIVYGGTYKGYMMRMDHSIDQTRSTNVWPDNPAGSGVEVMKYRFNWNYPVFFSLHDKNKLYAGSNYLHVTTNEGQSWEVISPDLTRNEPETLLSSGGLITQDNTGVEFYGTIFATAESAQEEGVMWVGSDDGLVHVTRDGGKTWKNVTPPGSPKYNMMNCIDVNPHVKGGAYLAATSYKFGDYTPYLYKTTDYGETWTKITSGIDDTHYTRAIRADKVKPGLLYAGTEWGMYVSFDDGINWQPFQLNLPIVAIRDLQVRDNDLIAATHGRSFWIIDDLTPLHQLNDEVAASNFYLFKPDDSYRMNQGGWGSPNTKLVGENHPDGVMVHYYLKDLAEKDSVSIKILDSSGELISTFSNNSKDKKLAIKPKKGGNRMVWDMRYPGFKEFKGMILYSSPNRGPKAMPGNYTVQLTVNGKTMEQPFTILKDPRLPNTMADYKKQFEFLMKVRNKVSEGHQAIIDIRKTKEDINYLREKIKGQPEFDQIKNMADELYKELDVIENNIHMTKNEAYQDPLNFGIRINNRLAFLMADQQRGDYPPTDQAEAFRKEVTQEMDKELKDLEKVYQEKLNQLNKAVQDKGLKLLDGPSPDVNQ